MTTKSKTSLHALQQATRAILPLAIAAVDQRLQNPTRPMTAAQVDAMVERVERAAQLAHFDFARAGRFIA